MYMWAETGVYMGKAWPDLHHAWRNEQFYRYERDYDVGVFSRRLGGERADGRGTEW